LQLYVAFEQLHNSFKIWQFLTQNPKAKVKVVTVNITVTYFKATLTAVATCMLVNRLLPKGILKQTSLFSTAI
jgi:hypothetical protein